MAIKQINIENMSTRAYAKSMVEEFMQSGFDAAIVEVPEDKTPSAVNQQCKNVIADLDLADRVVCKMKDGEVYLILAELA